MAESEGYVPESAPPIYSDSAELPMLARWVEGELLKIAKSFHELSLFKLAVQHVAPEKPRDGLIVYADGTDWDPGSGEGIYGYVNGAWNKLSV